MVDPIHRPTAAVGNQPGDEPPNHSVGLLGSGHEAYAGDHFTWRPSVDRIRALFWLMLIEAVASAAALVLLLPAILHSGFPGTWAEALQDAAMAAGLCILPAVLLIAVAGVAIGVKAMRFPCCITADREDVTFTCGSLIRAVPFRDILSLSTTKVGALRGIRLLTGGKPDINGMLFGYAPWECDELHAAIVARAGLTQVPHTVHFPFLNHTLYLRPCYKPTFTGRVRSAKGERE